MGGGRWEVEGGRRKVGGGRWEVEGGRRKVGGGRLSITHDTPATRCHWDVFLLPSGKRLLFNFLLTTMLTFIMPPENVYLECC